MLLGDDFYVLLVDDYRACLQQLASSARPDVDRHIPCHLFHQDQAVPAFTVGPVQFRPRSEWLDCFVKDTDVRELVRQVENRELNIEALSAQSMAAESGRHGVARIGHPTHAAPLQLGSNNPDGRT